MNGMQNLITEILTCKFWETYGKRTFADFIFKQIFLVQEENDGSICEPLVVADGVK